MRNRNRSNVLLVEILIAVLFFMLSATVLVKIFVTARNMTVRSGVESMAIADAQNVAETMYAAEDIDATLEGMGFYSSHGAWTLDRGDYTLYVDGQATSTEAGELWSGTVSAFYKLRNPDVARAEDEQLFSLTCTRYKGVAQS
jgi:Tfp pilus assembly protein PilV